MTYRQETVGDTFYWRALCVCVCVCACGCGCGCLLCFSAADICIL